MLKSFSHAYNFILLIFTSGATSNGVLASGVNLQMINLIGLEAEDRLTLLEPDLFSIIQLVLTQVGIVKCLYS